jgi:cobalt-zinc-cadmium efflux system outer membrane protein
VIARLAVDLPISWGKYRAAEREAASRRRALEAARRDVGVGLAAQLEKVRFAYREAVRTADLYGGSLLDKGRQTLAATTAAYRTGEADFLAVVDAQQTLLALELTAARAHADRLIHLAKLEQLIAGPASETAIPSRPAGD